ncbi:MAG: hypothetical protein ABI675_21640 [Chitinophagaceae bacterium]
MTPAFTDKPCLSCGKNVKGRADKKFCDDACRNSYNNELKFKNNINYIRNINNALLKNRRVLKNILEATPEEKITLHKDKLTRLGFNFRYITHTYTTKRAHTYFFCYDYGYMPLENDRYLIVKRKEE